MKRKDHEAPADEHDDESIWREIREQWQRRIAQEDRLIIEAIADAVRKAQQTINTETLWQINGGYEAVQALPLQRVLGACFPEILQWGGRDFFLRYGIDVQVIINTPKVLRKLYPERVFYEEAKRSFNYWFYHLHFLLGEKHTHDVISPEIDVEIDLTMEKLKAILKLQAN